MSIHTYIHTYIPYLYLLHISISVRHYEPCSLYWKSMSSTLQVAQRETCLSMLKVNSPDAEKKLLR